MEFFTFLPGYTNFSIFKAQETFTKSSKKVTLKVTFI